MQGLQLLLVASVAIALVSSCPYGNSDDGKRLIKTSEEAPGTWMDEAEIFALIEKHTNFVDITDHNFPQVKPEDVNTKAIPTAPRFQSTVNRALTTLSSSRMEQFIRTFSAYHNRYYTSTTGVQSQQWLLSQVQSAVVGYSGSVNVREFDHSWAQKSIIARIDGSDSSLRREVVVLGAHQDSINTMGSSLVAPGADDNASGSVTLLETLRVLVENNIVPKRTLEFQWYAAEEVGLRGSAAIAQSYKNSGVDVIGMLNFDVTAYYISGSEVIGIYTDYTNAAVNAFLRLLVDEYCVYRWVNTSCGYGCSDHASWTSYGFAAAMPSEYHWNPQMHRPGDTLDLVSMEQVTEYTKLAIGFAIEMTEPSN